eukprot:TRINITY_DN7151_c0_g1_i1.p1 TRINITY_DN7151_c0_g1~~TRINITY_DN7151_c0_g1_i1.p1  ORF type:complete len:159 (+),score=22.10 TRINITY_DN7151_c0_g1_i1:141-617(+)
MYPVGNAEPFEPKTYQVDRGLFGFKKRGFSPDEVNNKLSEEEFEDIVDGANAKIRIFDFFLNFCALLFIMGTYFLTDAWIVWESRPQREHSDTDGLAGLFFFFGTVCVLGFYVAFRFPLLWAAAAQVGVYLNGVNVQYQMRGLAFEYGKILGRITIRA